METEYRYTSRRSRLPLLNEHGNPIITRLTEDDLETFKLLTRYRYLPSNFIAKLQDRKPAAFIRRLGILSRKPNLYLNRPEQQWQQANANYTHAVYELDENGAEILRNNGIVVPPRRPHKNFAHELMACEVIASLEIGTYDDEHLRLITWDEIKASGKVPATTLERPKPYTLPVQFFYKENLTADITPDAPPFGIERISDGRKSYLFFFLEIDMGTEPVDSSDFDRSSIAKKFAAYQAIADQRLYQSHFGFPNFFVMFVAPTIGRLESMMDHFSKSTNGKGSKGVLFTTCPSMYSFDGRLKPDGSMLTREWQRVGYPAFSFLK